MVLLVSLRLLSTDLLSGLLKVNDKLVQRLNREWIPCQCGVANHLMLFSRAWISTALGSAIGLVNPQEKCAFCCRVLNRLITFSFAHTLRDREMVER